jgi:drug/metabolite transporter (DMT)-like permease
MEKLINSTKASSAKLIVVYIGVVLGMVGQYVALPLFIGSFDNSAGAYFILCWLGCLFNAVFWSLTLVRLKQGVITKDMLQYTKSRHWLFILQGFFNAINGVLIVYSSPLKRTPGSLQAILSSVASPFTVLFSKFILKKKYNSNQMIGVFLNIMGIVVSLIPIFNNPELGETNFIWPLMFVVGQIPIVFLNILEEKVFEEFPKYDSIFMIAWVSFYQIISFLLLFWVDIIPGFGISSDLNDWAHKFEAGFTCFFNPWGTDIDKCSFCFLTGAIFAVSYCFYSIFGAELMKYASANTTAVVSSMCPVLVVFFWISFPGLNKWADGKDYTGLDIICDVVALPIIVMGIAVYRISENKQINAMIQKHYTDETDRGSAFIDNSVYPSGNNLQGK